MSSNRTGIYFILILLFLTCEIKKGDDLGLKKVELKKEYLLSDSTKKDVFTFQPQESSNLYRFRLYFPEIEFETSDILFGELSEKIIKSLDGTIISIKDSKSQDIILEYRIDETKSMKEYSFNVDKPLSLHLGAPQELDKIKDYTVEVKFGSNQTSNEVNKVLLVIGLGRPVAL